MKAAWYESQGAAAEVIVVGEQPDPEPGEGEVRIRVAASGVNPGDVKKRQNAFGLGMPYPRVIPHSDGAGVIDRVGSDVSKNRIGERVWCYGAQSYRPFGTAAEHVVVPSWQAAPLPSEISFEQGACLGIPGITAHRAIRVAASLEGKTILVQGGAGAVGQCAVALARHAGADVVATVRSDRDEGVASRAGAQAVVRTDGMTVDAAAEAIRRLVPVGVDHVVEVAFDANIALDEAVLKMGGTIAAYATGDPTPPIPFWPLLFKNVVIYFLGSDDFADEEKVEAAQEINNALASGWSGPEVGRSFPLEAVADAHIAVEERRGNGRVVVAISEASR